MSTAKVASVGIEYDILATSDRWFPEFHGIHA